MNETPYQLGKARHRSLERVDAMPAELRACVHEFGFPVVSACVKHGVTKPAFIRELVKEIWLGARQAGQSNGARSTLDWLLGSTGGFINAATLFRVLGDNSIAVVSAEPTRAMLEASMDAVKWADGPLDKEEKHRRRLRAALRAGMAEQMR